MDPERKSPNPMIFTTQFIPNIPPNDGAIWRRIAIIPFSSQYKIEKT